MTTDKRTGAPDRASLPTAPHVRAFDAAIAAGRLSTDPGAANYVGRYMFMGAARDGRDLFKHIDTREYLP